VICDGEEEVVIDFMSEHVLQAFSLGVEVGIGMVPRGVRRERQGILP